MRPTVVEYDYPTALHAHLDWLQRQTEATLKELGYPLEFLDELNGVSVQLLEPASLSILDPKVVGKRQDDIGWSV